MQKIQIDDIDPHSVRIIVMIVIQVILIFPFYATIHSESVLQW